jgi:hypothetical protein
MSNRPIDFNAIDIELLPEERRVLLKHGYPIGDSREQLETIVRSKNLIETLVISGFVDERQIE